MRRIIMKKTVIIALIAVILSASAALAITVPMSEHMTKLVTARQIDCWVEGTVFGDMILGARGSIQFFYIDKELSDAIARENSLAPWIDDLNQYFGTFDTKKRAMFVAQVEANKPWTLSAGEIHVGGYSVTKDDIMQTSWKNPFEGDGAINSGEKWQFAFTVPRSELKGGKEEITVGYGTDLVKWKAPK